MILEEFKKELGKLTPPWIIEGNYIYSPSHMKPNEGYVGYIDPKAPLNFKEILEEIKTIHIPFYNRFYVDK